MKKFFFLLLFIYTGICSPAQNVGIGTTTPAYKLDVQNGSINTDSVYRIGGNTILSVKGTENTFLGRNVGNNNSGSFNTAGGFNALASNTTGNYNAAFGHQALFSNTTASNNTAFGTSALLSNTTGNFNTANGINALRFNQSADNNTATGFWALYANQVGGQNTATGGNALGNNLGGNNNTAIGYWAHKDNSTGNYNVAIGAGALQSTTASDFNVAVGYLTAHTRNYGWNNTFIGAEADATGNGFFNSIALGNIATINGSSQTRIGNSFTVSTGGYTGWTNISDGRYKKNVKEDVKGLEFILKLHPVTYQLNITAISNQLNENRGHEIIPQMAAAIAEKEKMILSGFLAQEVEQAAKAIGYEFSGVDKPANAEGLYGLRYAEFVVPLVKAVQEQQNLIATQTSKIENLEIQNRKIEQLEKQNELLLKRLEILENKNK